MKERVTIRDVAREANVSIATVSKALNGLDVVKPKTIEKVTEAAKKLHYTPNLMGKQLKTKTTKMIGLYTHTTTGPYFNTLIEAIVEEAEKHQYGVNVVISSDKQVLTSHLLGNMVDGFIGFEELIDETSLSTIRAEGIKAVFVDRKIKDESISSVVFDSRKAGRIATQHLIDRGHQKIGFLLGHVNVYDSDERYKGFREIMKEQNLAVNDDWVIRGLFEEKESYLKIKEYLLQVPKAQWPTAWLAGNDLSAIGVIKAIEEVGLMVPQDFSVVGFDDIELLGYFKPSITTVQNPIQEQGKQAVKELLRLIAHQKKGMNKVLDCGLIIRETTSNNQ
ncbi:alanine racemase [Enterococcus sp. JM4C]|uniref:LacI family DNA-binding transcriptional regulator n=1 Tax=Candidatus Enterococcus huntleyi TaxID=1857217 RepID=UPI00137B0BF6|nr:LacI family DNA-binding transcriptional regulator [Enterococcus sp. JM4C]KAF1299095.1 alanine racemase [Enterococcus sp. JM4C]